MHRRIGLALPLLPSRSGRPALLPRTLLHPLALAQLLPLLQLQQLGPLHPPTPVLSTEVQGTQRGDPLLGATTAPTAAPPNLLATLALWLAFLWLAHALAFFAHEFAHSFTAFFFRYKSNPLALNYGHLSPSNLLLQADIDENVDYAPIFAAGRGPIASLIAVAGVLIGNGLFYLVSRLLLRSALRARRRTLALFLFFLSLMNVGNLISYVPCRTFTDHADMHTVEQGLGISPWPVALLLGIPFCLAVAHFALRSTPPAMQLFYPRSRPAQLLLLAVTCSVLFAFFGSAGLHHHGPVSHGISATFLYLVLPLTFVADWLQTRSHP